MGTVQETNLQSHSPVTCGVERRVKLDPSMWPRIKHKCQAETGHLFFSTPPSLTYSRQIPHCVQMGQPQNNIDLARFFPPLSSHFSLHISKGKGSRQKRT